MRVIALVTTAPLARGCRLPARSAIFYPPLTTVGIRSLLRAVSENLGEVYALATAACWTGTAMFFAAAGRRIGSLVVNFIRLLMALALLALVTSFTRGLPLPTDATGHAWLWLSLSGLVGFTFGDLCLFRAFVLLGPRLSTLVMSFSPVLTALFGWLILGETLSSMQIIAMSLIVGGIGWAVLDRQPTAPGDGTPRDRWIGLLLGFGGAVGQAGGLVLSKYGMGSFDALAANEIRIIAGTVGFAVIFTVTGWWPKVRAGLAKGKAMLFTGAGAIAGPFLGVSFSLLAVQNTETGVAASIMGITPVLIIPITVIVNRERIGFGGIAGAIIAVVGVSLLFQ